MIKALIIIGVIVVIIDIFVAMLPNLAFHMVLGKPSRSTKFP